MTNQILRLPDVMRLTGLAKSTVYQKIVESDFPRSIKLGARSVGWLESEVNDWIETQILLSRPGGTNE